MLPCVVDEPRTTEFSFDLALVCTVKNGCDGAEAETVSGPTEVRFEYLSDIHTTRHTEGVQDDVDDGAIAEIGHIFDGDNLRDNTLVTMTACHLITLRQLALLCDTDTDKLINTCG